MIFRGDQYHRAIERHYFYTSPAGCSILGHRRTAEGWQNVIQDSLANRITGVYSPTGKEPLKQADFPEQQKHFDGKKKYSDWRFVSVPPQGQMREGQLIARVTATCITA